MKNQPFRRMDFSFAPGLKTSEDLPGLELRNPSRWHYLVGFMLWKGGSHPKYLNIIWTYLMQTKTRNLLEKLPKVLIVVIVILFLSPTILSSVADFFCSKTSTGSRSWETWYLERLFCFFSVQYLYCILYIYMTYISYISYIYRYTTIICKHIYIYKQLYLYKFLLFPRFLKRGFCCAFNCLLHRGAEPGGILGSARGGICPSSIGFVADCRAGRDAKKSSVDFFLAGWRMVETIFGFLLCPFFCFFWGGLFGLFAPNLERWLFRGFFVWVGGHNGNSPKRNRGL